MKAKETAYRTRRYQGAIVSYAPPVYDLGSYNDDEDDEEGDPTYEDDEVVEILPRRRVLRR